MLKLGIQHCEFENYQVCSNDNPKLILDLFTLRSILVPYAFVWGKTCLTLSLPLTTVVVFTFHCQRRLWSSGKVDGYVPGFNSAVSNDSRKVT